MRRLITALLPLAIGGSPATGQSADTAAALHLAQRATFGARPQDVTEILSLGADAWLDRQLHPERIPDSALDERLVPFARLDGSSADLYAAFPPPDQLGRELAERYGIDPARLREPGGRAALPREALRELRDRSPRRLFEDLATSKLIRAVHSRRQLEEVMTDFWFNHFNVYAGKQLTRYMIPDYERTAIRANVFGRFEDMLLATARHPAMLFYLDNWTSVVPDSLRPAGDDRQADRLRRLASLSDAQKERLVRQGRITREQLERLDQAAPMLEQARQRMRGRGLNENYARELMELHTLGVDGGYTQDDVVNVARALTGWTLIPFRLGNAQRRGPLADREPGTFVFNAAGHDRGAKTILGRTYPADRGLEEGEEVIRTLARSPQTARFLSTKLIERFVSDTPDAAFVDELAAVWMRTGGDLREVTRALFSSPRFRDAAVYGTKTKTPFELVASALRVTGSDVAASRDLMETLRSMGQFPYDASAPTGYPAMSEDWVNSGAMLARMNFGLDLAAGRVAGIHPTLDRIDDVGGVLATILPGQPAAELATVLREDAARDPSDAPTRTLGLALGSPEFQRR